MLTKSKVALSLAFVLGSAPAAMAAAKHAVHRHHTAVVRHVPASGYLSFASARGSGQLREPAYIYIQDKDYRDNQ